MKEIYARVVNWLSKNLSKVLIFTITLVVGITIDQISKGLVRTNMVEGDSIEVIKGFFFITFATNTGAAFSFLSGNVFLLSIISILEVGAFTFILFKYKKKSIIFFLACSLVVTGGFSNLIDRVFLHYVVDFFHFRFFGKYDYAIFNVADICVVAGFIGFLIYFFIIEPKQNKKESQENNETNLSR